MYILYFELFMRMGLVTQQRMDSFKCNALLVTEAITSYVINDIKHFIQCANYLTSKDKILIKRSCRLEVYNQKIIDTKRLKAYSYQKFISKEHIQ